MQVADLGDLPEEIVLFGGPYSNLPALQALVDVVGDRTAICTGDVVAYSAWPEETATLLIGLGWPVVAGNCEQQIARGADDCGCGFEDGTVCDRLSSQWYPFARDRVSEETRRWMGGLPDVLTFTQSGKRYAVVHGGATDVARYVWPCSQDADFEAEFAALEASVGAVDAVVAGHCGLAFDRMVGSRRWINAGVIGLAPHDSRPATRFTTLTKGEPVFHRLIYDHEAARRRMEAEGLTGYAEAITSGIWPSEDVLPKELRH